MQIIHQIYKQMKIKLEVLFRMMLQYTKKNLPIYDLSLSTLLIRYI